MEACGGVENINFSSIGGLALKGMKNLVPAFRPLAVTSSAVRLFGKKGGGEVLSRVDQTYTSHSTHIVFGWLFLFQNVLFFLPRDLQSLAVVVSLLWVEYVARESFRLLVFCRWTKFLIIGLINRHKWTPFRRISAQTFLDESEN